MAHISQARVKLHDQATEQEVGVRWLYLTRVIMKPFLV